MAEKKLFISIKGTLDLHPDTKQRRVMYKEEKMKIVKYALFSWCNKRNQVFQKRVS